MWTWLLFYLTGQLFFDPLIAAWISKDRVVKIALGAIPLIYLFTWFYEQHFFFALFKADRNAFILTGSQIYFLIVALVIAANGVRFRRNVEFKEAILATISKTMTGGVYSSLFGFSPSHCAYSRDVTVDEIHPDGADVHRLGADLNAGAIALIDQKSDYDLDARG
ncbi:Uncharacterised protein [Lelliottia amnigena]|nr:Uncharacterised protein [Lelliottia amnigena]